MVCGISACVFLLPRLAAPLPCGVALAASRLLRARCAAQGAAYACCSVRVPPFLSPAAPLPMCGEERVRVVRRGAARLLDSPRVAARGVGCAATRAAGEYDRCSPLGGLRTSPIRLLPAFSYAPSLFLVYSVCFVYVNFISLFPQKGKDGALGNLLRVCALRRVGAVLRFGFGRTVACPSPSPCVSRRRHSQWESLFSLVFAFQDASVRIVIFRY